MKTDTLFYRLFKNAPELVLELAKLDYTDAKGYRFSSEEIKQTAFRLDGILTPPEDKTHLPIIFIEVQFQPDQHFYSRFFCEIFFYLHQNKPTQAWRAVIIYPTHKTETNGNLHYAELLETERVKRIYLEDLIDAPSNPIGLQLIQLIVVEEKNAIKKAQKLLNHIKIHANQETIAYWQEWVETIMVYKLPKLSRQEIQEMLGYNDIELKQTQFYQDVFSEGVQEGKLEGESTIILRILKRRLGPLNEKTILEIQTLNNQQLEALSDNLLDFSSKNDLDNWLEQNQ
ncbi:Rpn family recombination-promoting nuclease/putative transposase [methanotrophic endosymbiont of Bathymodiolus puteoserpentis (Logatchev)]|jgi:predicted transposase/invertase (TIGR01784 family)|uniref:Rpn family recombination-promoting nuclease/putative transposase n=1 Tax=methanotrophic endosymbiont of Bathymodiolus puteoserpentis (Logatchev) TaxID=343235 RepID=UPI0013C6CFBC|nr:Rpn family recombination-promoting nuclease/putative transposase [methanotrophic endosymbiont of Bathymodiolus puteoserpentis (Logatchev)]SHE23214.1 hypothetical protein BPUTEOMOX_1509 [methanotrophic endosymbiont of Bathymodiolus puteoserpentis (Logatchev)]